MNPIPNPENPIPMTSSLKKQAIHGAFWSFAERFGQQGVQFVVGVVLARLLTPKDFGVIGMITIFVVLAQSVIDSGFGQALIQKQNADHRDESTVFCFNLLTGLFMAVILYACAPWIAVFYDTPILSSITRVLSLNLIINSFGIVQNSLLTKELAFKKRMKATVSSIVLSGAVGIYMAWRGFGVWSLVGQQLTANTVRVAAFWIVHPWRPSFVFDRSSFLVLWKFGSNLLFTGLLTTFFKNIYMVVIGKIYSAAELGFYQRSRRFMMLTSESVSQVIAQVQFPLLSRVQNEPVRLKQAFTKILQMTMLLIIPMMTGLAIVADDFIYVLLGEQWMPCVPYLRIMCISSLAYPLSLMNLNYLKVCGRTDLILRLSLIKKVLVIGLIVILYHYGVIWLLWGEVASTCVVLFMNTFYTKRFINCGLLAQLASMRSVFLSSLVMGLVVWHLGQSSFLGIYSRLALQIPVGLLSFIFAEFLLKDEAFFELVEIVAVKLGIKMKRSGA